MNEETFRKRYRQAIGDPPPAAHLQHAIAARLAAPDRRTSPRLAGAVAFVLAAAVVAGLAGPRLLHRPAAAPRPAASAAATPARTSSPIDPSHCRLPAVAMSEAGPPPQLRSLAGFVDTSTGAFTADPAASVEGLPGGGSPGTSVKPGLPAAPAQYSSATHRWLPVGGAAVAPDGRSYLWVRLLPDGSSYSDFKTTELHRFDVARLADSVVWSYPGSITIVRWDGSQALVDTVPPGGGEQLFWLIDAAAGTAQRSATAYPQRPTELPGDAQSGRLGYGSMGTDFQGHPVFRLGSREPGSVEWIFVEVAPGVRQTIYQGVQGDSTHFDPFGTFADATGLWFGDYDDHTLWHWSPEAGLKPKALTGLPAPLAGYANSTVTLRPAGPCLPA